MIYFKNSFLSIDKKLFFCFIGVLNKLAHKLLNNIIGKMYMNEKSKRSGKNVYQY